MILAPYSATQSLSVSVSVNWKCPGTLKSINMEIQVQQTWNGDMKMASMLEQWNTRKNLVRCVCTAWRRIKGDLMLSYWGASQLPNERVQHRCSQALPRNSTKGNEHMLKHQKCWLARREEKKHHEDGHIFEKGPKRVWNVHLWRYLSSNWKLLWAKCLALSRRA